MEIQKIFSSYDDYGYEDERIYSVLMSEEEMMMFSEIQREFTGAVKAANKAAKRAWLERQGAGGFLGIGKKTGDEAIRRARMNIDSELVKTGRSGILRLENGIPTKSIPSLDPKKISSLNEKINRKGVMEEGYMRERYKKYGDNKFRTRSISPSKGRNRITRDKNLITGETSFFTPESKIRSINTIKSKR